VFGPSTITALSFVGRVPTEQAAFIKLHFALTMVHLTRTLLPRSSSSTCNTVCRIIVAMMMMLLLQPSSVIAIAPIKTMMEQLDGNVSQPYLPTIPIITGPFYVEIEVHFYNQTLLHTSRHRIFDFSTNSTSHSISLTIDNGASLSFQYTDDSGRSHLISVVACYDIVTAGTTDLWRVGVDASGTMTLHKNGELQGVRNNVVPPTGAIRRTRQLLGMSTVNGADGLKGVISGLKVRNLDEPEPPIFRSLNNLPAQVFSGSFKASVYARFDDVTTRSGQPIFELSDATGDNRILFAQDRNTSGLILSVHQNGVTSSCEASNKLINNRGMLLWKIEMAGPIWTIQRSYNRKEDDTVKICIGMVAPAAVFRRNMLFGRSMQPSVSVLDGVVLGFRLDDNVD
jgi:hypothetical protein